MTVCAPLPRVIPLASGPHSDRGRALPAKAAVGDPVTAADTGLPSIVEQVRAARPRQRRGERGHRHAGDAELGHGDGLGQRGSGLAHLGVHTHERHRQVAARERGERHRRDARWRPGPSRRAPRGSATFSCGEPAGHLPPAASVAHACTRSSVGTEW